MEKKRILVIDDDSERISFFIESFGHQRLDIIENTDDAISYLADNIYDYIFFGAEEEPVGSEVAEFLSEQLDNPNNDARLIIHSWDVDEITRILELLPQASCLPFNEAAFSTMF